MHPGAVTVSVSEGPTFYKASPHPQLVDAHVLEVLAAAAPAVVHQEWDAVDERQLDGRLPRALHPIGELARLVQAAPQPVKRVGAGQR
jgi:hypothetical protein